MQVIVNGKPRELPPATTVSELLKQLEMSSKQVAVEINLELVPRARHADHQLNDGDQLEIVSFVGGG